MVLQNPDYCCERRVRFIDTDAWGTMHFSKYVQLMEETEYAFLRSRGLSVVMDDARGKIGFPRTHTNFSIERPAVYDERLETWLKLVDVDGVTISYQFAITAPGMEQVARGSFVVACCRFVPGELPRAILIPDPILWRLQAPDGPSR